MSYDIATQLGFNSNAIIRELPIGRTRVLRLSDHGGPNEMLFIKKMAAPKSPKCTDIICIHNRDFDGPLTDEKLTTIVSLFKTKP